MPLPLQLLKGTVVLRNRFGDGPLRDCERFVRVELPQGIEIEGVYNARRGRGRRNCARFGSMVLTWN